MAAITVLRTPSPGLLARALWHRWALVGWQGALWALPIASCWSGRLGLLWPAAAPRSAAAAATTAAASGIEGLPPRRQSHCRTLVCHLLSAGMAPSVPIAAVLRWLRRREPAGRAAAAAQLARLADETPEMGDAVAAAGGIEAAVACGSWCATHTRTTAARPATAGTGARTSPSAAARRRSGRRQRRRAAAGRAPAGLGGGCAHEWRARAERSHPCTDVSRPPACYCAGLMTCNLLEKALHSSWPLLKGSSSAGWGQQGSTNQLSGEEEWKLS